MGVHPRAVVHTVLLLGVVATPAQPLEAGEPPAAPARAETPVAVAALQDMVDASTAAKSQFSAFSDRVNTDVDRLQHEFQKERAEIADLQLEKQSLKSANEQQRLKLGHELEEFKRRTLGKLAELQATDKRLEEQNTVLVTSNQKLASDLEQERGKKDVLVKKLRKMAGMFNHQTTIVQQMVAQQQSHVTDEVNMDMRDALAVAGDNGVVPPASVAPSSLPTLDAAPSDPLEAAMTLPGDATNVPSPAPAAPRAVVATAHPRRLRVLNTPRPAELPLARAPAAGEAPLATASVAAYSAPPVPPAVPAAPPLVPPAPVVPAPTAAPAQAAPVSDDEQLKSLRAEVEKLEASVNDPQGAPQSAPQEAGASLLETGSSATTTSEGDDEAVAAQLTADADAAEDA